MTAVTEGSGGLKALSLYARMRVWEQTGRPSVTLRCGDHAPSSPSSIQSQSPWVRDGAPTCSDCGWPLDSVGHEVNCEEPA